MAGVESTFKLLKRGMDAADRGDTLAAQIPLELAVNQGREPLACSYLAYCRAAQEQDFDAAVHLCQEALAREPDNALHYLNMGRIYRLMGQPQKGLDTLAMGLRVRRHPLILQELRSLGVRRPPLLPWLGRSHPLNRTLGRFFSWARPLAQPE